MSKGKQHRSPQIKKCAIILREGIVEKIYDYPQQYKELNSNPDIFIYEDCDEAKLEQKWDYWNRIVNYNPDDQARRDYHFLHYNERDLCN